MTVLTAGPAAADVTCNSFGGYVDVYPGGLDVEIALERGKVLIDGDDGICSGDNIDAINVYGNNGAGEEVTLVWSSRLTGFYFNGGTGGGNYLVVEGTDRKDVIDLEGIVSYWQVDWLYVHGNGGRDTLIGSDSVNSTLEGGGGRDRLFAGDAYFFIYGDEGSDRIEAQTSGQVYGGDGHDFIDLYNGSYNYVEGDDGVDRCSYDGGLDDVYECEKSL